MKSNWVGTPENILVCMRLQFQNVGCNSKIWRELVFQFLFKCSTSCCFRISFFLKRSQIKKPEWAILNYSRTEYWLLENCYEFLQQLNIRTDSIFLEYNIFTYCCCWGFSQTKRDQGCQKSLSLITIKMLLHQLKLAFLNHLSAKFSAMCVIKKCP